VASRFPKPRQLVICLIDTSILCEFLEVPNRCDRAEEITAEVQRKIERGETLLLPMSSILETGNHVGQNGDGRRRRAAAERFVVLVEQAIRGETPFTPTPLFEPEQLLAWLREFPDWAGHGSGFADLTIAQEFHRQRSLHPLRRVYIWSLDGHLSSYDTLPGG
jgi:predicted RNA-binding protein with TRAM domain